MRSHNVYTPSNTPCRVIPALDDAIYPVPQPTASFTTRAQAFLLRLLNAVSSTVNKSAVRVFASASTVVRVLDACGSNARGLAAPTVHCQLSPQTPHKLHLRPEKGPVVIVGSHLTASGRGALIRLASSVRGTVVLVVLVIDAEDGKRLLARDTGVVRALGRLDSIGDLGGCILTHHIFTLVCDCGWASRPTDLGGTYGSSPGFEGTRPWCC